MLAGSGIDTKLFKGHSVRGASTSAAFRISTSMSAAGWSSDYTFNRFYDRRVQSDDFSDGVMKAAENCIPEEC